MGDLLPEDRAISAFTERALDAIADEPHYLMPEGWRIASYEDLTGAGWSDEEIDDIGPVVIDADGQLREVEIDVSLPVLRRATAEELAAANAALASLGPATGTATP